MHLFVFKGLSATFSSFNMFRACGVSACCCIVCFIKLLLGYSVLVNVKQFQLHFMYEMYYTNKYYYYYYYY